MAPRATASAQAELARTIRRTAAVAGVAPELSVAVARAESNLDRGARSTDGLSFGTFQMTRATANEMQRRISAGKVTRPPGSDDVALGVGYLRYLQDLFSRGGRLGGALKTVAVGDPSERQLFTVAAYNAGEGRVAQAQAKARAAGGDPTRFAEVRRYLPSTTRAYVQRVSTFARGSDPPIVA
jgi:membrane-bound lytic murein transglycosylase MltF